MTYRNETIGRKNDHGIINERDAVFCSLNHALFQRRQIIRRIERGYAYGPLDDKPARLEAALRSLRLAHRLPAKVLP